MSKAEIMGKTLTDLPSVGRLLNADKGHLLIIWVVFFCYSTVIALLFQKLLLPQIPSLHAGNGLMNNDAIYFHQVASAMAESIREAGWSAWKMWPSTGAMGNVAVLGALYALFGPDPSLVIPLNAALHATGGILILLMGVKLADGRKGFIAGLIASILFVTFPSALNWYGQVHKDGYVIAGVLLILYVWLVALKSTSITKGSWSIVAGTIGGIMLIAFTRPYVLKLLLLATLTVWSFNFL